VGDRDDTVEQRLLAGDAVSGFFSQTTGAGGRHGFATPIVIEDELHFEAEELSVRSAVSA
jgi:hypothetical protein